MKLIYNLLFVLCLPCYAADLVFAAHGQFNTSGKQGVAVETKLPERKVVYFDVEKGIIWSKAFSSSSEEADLISRAAISGDNIVAVCFGGKILKINNNGEVIESNAGLLPQTAIKMWVFDDTTFFVMTCEWNPSSKAFQYFIYKILHGVSLKLDSKTEVEVDSSVYATKKGVFVTMARKTIQISNAE